MNTLYELSKEMQEIAHDIEQLEVDEREQSQLPNLLLFVQQDAEAHVSQLVKWRENLLAEAEALDTEAKILKEKRDAKKKKAEGIKEFIAQFLVSVKKTKFNAGIRSLHFRKGSVSTLCDEAEIENWSPEFFDSAIALGAVVQRYEVKVSILKNMPGYLEQPGVVERVGDESLVIK